MSCVFVIMELRNNTVKVTEILLLSNSRIFSVIKFAFDMRNITFFSFFCIKTGVALYTHAHYMHIRAIYRCALHTHEHYTVISLM